MITGQPSSRLDRFGAAEICDGGILSIGGARLAQAGCRARCSHPPIKGDKPHVLPNSGRWADADAFTVHCVRAVGRTAGLQMAPSDLVPFARGRLGHPGRNLPLELPVDPLGEPHAP
ncbi:hypothetical protein D3C71_1863460 [compost metagenome]